MGDLKAKSVVALEAQSGRMGSRKSGSTSDRQKASVASQHLCRHRR